MHSIDINNPEPWERELGPATPYQTETLSAVSYRDRRVSSAEFSTTSINGIADMLDGQLDRSPLDIEAEIDGLVDEYTDTLGDSIILGDAFYNDLTEKTEDDTVKVQLPDEKGLYEYNIMPFSEAVNRVQSNGLDSYTALQIGQQMQQHISQAGAIITETPAEKDPLVDAEAPEKADIYFGPGLDELPQYGKETFTILDVDEIMDNTPEEFLVSVEDQGDHYQFTADFRDYPGGELTYTLEQNSLNMYDQRNGQLVYSQPLPEPADLRGARTDFRGESQIWTLEIPKVPPQPVPQPVQPPTTQHPIWNHRPYSRQRDGRQHRSAR